MAEAKEAWTFERKEVKDRMQMKQKKGKNGKKGFLKRVATTVRKRKLEETNLGRSVPL